MLMLVSYKERPCDVQDDRFQQKQVDRYQDVLIITIDSVERSERVNFYPQADCFGSRFVCDYMITLGLCHRASGLFVFRISGPMNTAAKFMRILHKHRDVLIQRHADILPLFYYNKAKDIKMSTCQLLFYLNFVQAEDLLLVTDIVRMIKSWLCRLVYRDVLALRSIKPPWLYIHLDCVARNEVCEVNSRTY